ncbi:NHL repeat-containing protein 2 [Armadillidium vulgare]|nr:NHL repeat-containing protein 2 [Armadillidium vulgare]
MGEGKKNLLFKFVESSLKYFDKMKSLDPKHLPLLPHLHLPSEESGLYYPGKIHSFPEGLIISDSGNNRILITDHEGNIKHRIGCMKRGFADGSFNEAAFNNPQGVVYHPSGIVYVADTDNHSIRKIDLQANTVTTIAGNGTQGYDKEGGLLWVNQVISSPWDLCLGRSLDVSCEAHSNILFIAMAGLHQIWGIFLSSGLWFKKQRYPEGTVIALAGSGLEENRNTSYPLRAGFAQPSGIDIWNSPGGQILFIADSESSSIRQFSLIDGSVKRVAGGSVNPTDLFAFGDEDGDSHSAKFQHPLGVAVAEGNIFVADTYNHKVKLLRRTDKKNYQTETVIGDGCKIEQIFPDLCQLGEPGGICYCQNGNTIYIADTNNFCIKEYNIEQRTLRKIDLKFSCEANDDFCDSKERIKVNLPPCNVRVNMMAKLKMPNGFHFTPEMDQKYSLNFQGEICSPNSEGSLGYETKIPIEVNLSHEQRAELQLTTKLFLCSEEGTCYMDKKLITIEFVAEEGEYPSEIDVHIEIKASF